MKRMSMTFEDDIYYPIIKMAKENKTTFRKIVMNILYNEIYKPKELIDIGKIQNDVSECLFLLDKIKKEQRLHYNVSVQHFVNHGYLANANPSESITYQDILNKYKNKFND